MFESVHQLSIVSVLSYKPVRVLDIYKTQLFVTKFIFQLIPYTIFRFKFFNNKFMNNEMSGITRLICCKNVFATLGVHDHKCLDIFRVSQMVLIICYEDHNNILTTAKEATKFMPKSLHDYYNNHVLTKS